MSGVDLLPDTSPDVSLLDESLSVVLDACFGGVKDRKNNPIVIFVTFQHSACKS